jgi:hypothetical protein
MLLASIPGVEFAPAQDASRSKTTAGSLSMAAFPPDPDGYASLTRHEQRVLAHIERELRATDALLDVAVTDGVLPLPHWMIWMGRAALILIPLVLLVPVAWSIGIAAAIAVLGSLSRPAEGRS